jgi:nicotinate-nucleotide adenylyltransferase
MVAQRIPYTDEVTKRIGIYSGTFDPVHAGHIALATEAVRACDLDKVIFFVEKRPRDKLSVTSFEHREALLRIPTDLSSQLSVGNLVSDQFSVLNTLPELRSKYPTESLTLLMGSDVAMYLPSWQGVDALLADMSLAIGLRAGDTADDIIQIMNTIDNKYNIRSNYTILTTIHPNARSSHIRNAQVQSSLKHSEMDRYIQMHNLYQ